MLKEFRPCVEHRWSYTNMVSAKLHGMRSRTVINKPGLFDAFEQMLGTMRSYIVPTARKARAAMSAEDLEVRDRDGLQLYKYRDIVRQFTTSWSRAALPGNAVDVQVRNSDSEVYFEVAMSDAWCGTCTARPFRESVRVITFKDVNVELDKTRAPVARRRAFGA